MDEDRGAVLWFALHIPGVPATADQEDAEIMADVLCRMINQERFANGAFSRVMAELWPPPQWITPDDVREYFATRRATDAT